MKAMKALAVLALLLVGATAVPAQHTHTLPMNVIDGKTRPAEIPVTLAFRSWLSTVIGDQPVNDYSLRQVGLSNDDNKALLVIVKSHQTALEMLTARRKSEQDTRDQYWFGYNELTRQNWLDAKNTLSEEGFNQLAAFLETFKASMAVSVYDTGLGDVAKRNLELSKMVATKGGMVPQALSMTSNYSTTNNSILNRPHNGTDSFSVNGALSSNWHVRYGSFNVSNKNVLATSGGGANGEAVAYWATNSTSSWQQCSLAKVGVVVGTNAVGPAINISATQQTYYAVGVYQTGVNIYKALNGAPVTIGATYSHAPVSGDAYQICNDGAGHLTASLNGTTIISVTDTAIQSGYTGIREGRYGTNPALTLTYFNASSNPTSITVNATVSGDTLCGFPPDICNAALHTPVVKNYNTLRGSTFTGAPAPAPQPINVIYTITYPLTDFGNPGNPVNAITAEEEIDCSDLGLFVDFTQYIQGFYEHTQTTGNNGKCPGPACVASEVMLCYPPIASMNVVAITVADNGSIPYLMPSPQYDNWGVGFSPDGHEPWYFVPGLVVSTPSFNPGTVPCTYIP